MSGAEVADAKLLAKCVEFVEEQSVGEWDDKTIRSDAETLALFVLDEHAALVAERDALRKISADLYKLTLVIESAVRAADPCNYEAVLRLLKANQALHGAALPHASHQREGV